MSGNHHHQQRSQREPRQRQQPTTTATLPQQASSWPPAGAEAQAAHLAHIADVTRKFESAFDATLELLGELRLNDPTWQPYIEFEGAASLMLSFLRYLGSDQDGNVFEDEAAALAWVNAVRRVGEDAEEGEEAQP